MSKFDARIRHTHEDEEVVHDLWDIELAVTPPLRRLSTDDGGGLVRLREDEGRITIQVVPDRLGRPQLEVRGRHSLTVDYESGNVCYVRLADDERADDEVVRQ